jgi:hypothetical protein
LIFDSPCRNSLYAWKPSVMNDSCVRI